MSLFDNMGERQMQELFTAFWKRCEETRVLEAQKLWYWYIRDKAEVVNCIKVALAKIFRQKTIDRMNVRVFLVVDRIIDRLAKIYKLPASRSLDGGMKTSIDDGGVRTTQQSPSDKNYQELLSGSTLNKQATEFEKQLNLFNTCFMQPVWRSNFDDPNQRPFMDFLIHNPAWSVIEWSDKDFRKPKAFYYPIWINLTGTIEQVLVYWSKDEHFYVDRVGNRKMVPGMSSMTNPYGILPLATGRIKDSTDGYGEGKWELVEGNEEICGQVTNLYYTAYFQSHGQPVSINMGLKGEPEIGPDKPIVVDSAGGKEQQPSSFDFAHASPMIKEVQDMINWSIGMLQNLKGMTGQSISLDPTIQSGISKMQDSAELQESRQDMVSILEDFEHDLFRVTRVVWNYHNPGKKIADDAEFSVHFAEPKVLKTADEKVKEREAAIKQGTGSRIDFIMEDHPELNREEAEQKLQQNLAENRKFADRTGILDALNVPPATPENQPAPGNQQ